jgi:hypothetical protein
MAPSQLKPALACLQISQKAKEFSLFHQRHRLDHEPLGLIEAKLVQQIPNNVDVCPTGILNIIYR